MTQTTEDYENSEVVRTWNAISDKFGNSTEFYNLSLQAQSMFIQAINTILVIASGQYK